MAKERVSKEQYKVNKEQEFYSLVKAANNPNGTGLSRRLAIQELERIRARKDDYNRQNNKPQLVKDLRKRADLIEKKIQGDNKQNKKQGKK